MNVNSDPLVSICCVTYNHESFIKQCLDGFVMQQTNFLFEILVHEDASTDITAKILREYESKYPQLFRCVYQTENQFLKQNTLINILFPMARGKYIALCEGDDYWTDEYKLQKQVDFLEANEDYAICFHRVYELKEEKELKLSNLNTSEKEETYTIENLANGNFIHTPSVVFRNGLIKEFPAWFFKSPVGDYPLSMLNAGQGKIKYLPEPMSVYRHSVGGIWGAKASIYQITNFVIVIDYLIAEFESNIIVVANLRRQKNCLLLALLKEYLKGDNIELFKTNLVTAIDKNDQFLLNWIDKEFLPLLKEKEEIRNTLLTIQHSTTYRLLKRLRVFK
ncbi:MAG: glycosyltransferase [Ferruginibacter sp.]